MRRDETPIFFSLFLVVFLSASKGFARKIWQFYPASQTLIWQLMLCAEGGPQNGVERMKRLSQILTGAELIYTSMRLSPENGRQRLPECVEFEK